MGYGHHGEGQTKASRERADRNVRVEVTVLTAQELNGRGDIGVDPRRVARHVARHQLAERSLGALRPALFLRGARAAGGPFGCLGHDEEPGDLLAYYGVADLAGGLGPFQHEVDAAGALRIPLVG